MTEIILATHNLGKLEELKTLLADMPLKIKSLKDYPHLAEIEETGKTFQENAAIKANAVFSFTGLPTIADDSGIEVAALANAPGVYSSRYAGIDGDDSANNEKLLKEMTNIPPEQRDANFRSVICFKFGKDKEIFTEGICLGKIALAPKGEKGFGYDPLFLTEPDFKKTMAELTMAEKNLISHRGRAFQKLKSKLEQLLEEGEL